MKEEIDKIRELLDLIENLDDFEAEVSFKCSFDLFELPEVFSSVVDYLQPLLTPYEAAIYWYMFRHSIVETGDVFVRVSIRGMKKGVVVSRSGQSTDLSYKMVSTSLAGLIKKEAIDEAGDTNRQGTLYRVFLPEEIESCRVRMEEVQKEKLPEIDPKKELDYYNIKENRLKVFERDGYRCNYCKKQLTRFSATLDHIHPVSEDGDNSYDNLITACLHCNSRKGSRPVMDVVTKS